MVSRITDVRHRHNHVLELTFEDGWRAELDLHDKVVGRGGVFEALEDVDYFRSVRLDPEFGALVWPNDVDFCPETLREWAGAPASSD